MDTTLIVVLSLNKFTISKEWIVTISDPAVDIENGYRKQHGSGIELSTSQLLTG